MSLVLYSTFIQRAFDKVYSPAPVSIRTIRSNLGLAQMAAISSVLHRVSLLVLELNLACDLSPTCQRLSSFSQASNMSSVSFPCSTVKETTEPYS